MTCCPGPSGSPRSPDRRAFLRNAGGGFGAIALAALLADEGKLFAAPVADALPIRELPATWKLDSGRTTKCRIKDPPMRLGSGSPRTPAGRQKREL